uniref:Uncharacterized protein n=1 Tax=Rhizophora mucronata TaxID=61149 RepID=A0A2P2PS52_RHIMU
MIYLPLLFFFKQKNECAWFYLGFISMVPVLFEMLMLLECLPFGFVLTASWASGDYLL